MENLAQITNNFNKKRIAVLGDLMLDQFVWGEAKRISPEAPVPVVFVKRETFVPGGAANTASNIASLGGEVFLFGILGADKAGSQLLQELKIRKINTEGILAKEDRKTTQKTRIVAQTQQIVRVDREDTDYISQEDEKKLALLLEERIQSLDGLVISDYGKGAVTGSLAAKAIELALKFNKIVIGNTKKPEHASYFRNASLLIANAEEASAISNEKTLELSGSAIQKELLCNVMITQGPEGMTLFEKNERRHFPTKAKEVFDVSGAGDTVVSAFALSLASGAGFAEAAVIANHAAGIAVGKIGTAVVLPAELQSSLRETA